jgi:hypothetical protein
MTYPAKARDGGTCRAEAREASEGGGYSC